MNKLTRRSDQYAIWDIDSDGKPHGEYIMFGQDDKVKNISTTVHGVPIRCVHYSSSGKIFKVLHYSENGETHGEFAAFTPDGKKLISMLHVNGVCIHPDASGLSGKDKMYLALKHDITWFTGDPNELTLLKNNRIDYES